MEDTRVSCRRVTTDDTRFSQAKLVRSQAALTSRSPAHPYPNSVGRTDTSNDQRVDNLSRGRPPDEKGFA